MYLSKRYEASGKGVTNPDFKKISKAYGINYCRIENHNEIAKKLDKVLKSNTPEFIDVIINPNQKIEPKLQFGNPIEDLSPLLNRNEFKKNMLIGSIRKKNKLIEIN